MKYWRGYIVAAFFLALTLALTQFAAGHTGLVDMVYPYTTRLILTSLAEWTAGAAFCLWQLIVVVLVTGVLASLVVTVILRWNLIQWAGWILAGCSFLWLMHTGIYGLNTYAGSIAEDIRLNEVEYNVTDLVEATDYYMQIASQLATEVPRDEEGNPQYPTFAELAEMAGTGFTTLSYDRYYAVFAGSTLPVKELGWADLYTSMGITGVTMPLTGEAAVNPQTPVVALPFVMCHEMCHRMCISVEKDANMGAFLACDAHPDVTFRYSGYFMAFRYCYNALISTGTTTSKLAASQLYAKAGDLLKYDMKQYDEFFAAKRNETASQVANTANDAYIKGSGDESGVKSYSQVTDLLVSWYVQEIYLPAHKEEIIPFDPTDKNQVDLSEGINQGGNG